MTTKTRKTMTLYIKNPGAWKKASRYIRFFEDRSLSAHLEEYVEAVAAQLDGADK